MNPHFGQFPRANRQGCRFRRPAPRMAHAAGPYIYNILLPKWLDSLIRVTSKTTKPADRPCPPPKPSSPNNEVGRPQRLLQKKNPSCPSYRRGSLKFSCRIVAIKVHTLRKHLSVCATSAFALRVKACQQARVESSRRLLIVSLSVAYAQGFSVG